MYGKSKLAEAAALLLLTLGDVISAAKPSPGCGKAAGIAAGNHTLHAMGGNPTLVANGEGGYLPWYGLPALVNDDIGAIYVNPNGLDRGWANRGGEDVTLMTDILKTVKENLCIDENLVFSVGFSYGASMSTALACSSAKLFRAVSAQSGGLMSGCVGGDDPIAFYGQHGVDGDLNITAARGIRDRFIKNNGCTQEEFKSPVKGSGVHAKVEYKGCKEGYPVTWLEYDGGHTPQPRDKGANATYSAVETWKFFSQFK